MCPSPSQGSSLNREAEGARCKASLQAFTQGLAARLEIPQHQAERLHQYDRSRTDGNVYLHFPFCFSDVFPNVLLDHFRTLSFSGTLWMSYMRAQDDAIDRPRTADPTALFLRDAYLRESLHLLYKLFPCNSKFWSFYSSYFDEYARSVLHEQGKNLYMDVSNDESFHSIAKGKAAMAKYPVAALAVLSRGEDKLPLLTDSLDCFHVGYQYWDDLVDWKEDSENSKRSLLLARALARIPPEKRSEEPDKLRAQVGRVVYYSGLAQQQLDDAFKWFERASELSLMAGGVIWANHVKTLQQQTVTLAKDLRSMISAKTSGSDTALSA
jgi:hypothetical protein